MTTTWSTRELRREQGDRESARRYLLQSEELGKQGGISENRHRWYVAMARLEEDRGDPNGALDLLDEAERLYVRSPDPDVRPIAALRARVWIRQGRLAGALDWVREQDLSVDDNLSYLREFEHVTLARVLIARSGSGREDTSIQRAMMLLDRLLQAAEEGGKDRE
ncbi:MAG: hypothetical protein ACFB50_08885 [Rubrobacteraceae bacterium]